MGGDDDQKLVAAARRGDDRAFEALYARYHRPIGAYVLAMVRDHGRAEDLTQEVFLSALRRMRETGRPIAFEPWIYAIARNACIDHFRRSKRTPEVPLEGDLSGSHVGSAPTPDAALGVKLELDHLRGALGVLPDNQHEVLVLRELEGLSHREIGERLGLSRAAVESTLSRARRRLAEEYEEIASGARCRRIQRIIATAPGAATHQSHRFARHLAHCQTCRRAALAAGIDTSALGPVPLRRRAAGRIAALLPFPALARFLRGRGGGAEAGTALAPGGSLAPALSEQLHAGWAKAAAIVAVLIAGAGTSGVGTTAATDPDRATTVQSRTAPEAPRADAEPGGSGAPAPVGSRRGRRGDDRRQTGLVSDRPSRERPARGDRGTRGAGQPAPSYPAPSGGGAPVTEHRSAGDTGDDGAGSGGDPRDGESAPEAPSGDAPAGERPPQMPLTTGVTNTVAGTLDGIDETVRGATGGVDQTLQGAGLTLQGSPHGVDQTLDGVSEAVEGAVGGLDSTLEGAGDGLGETLAGVGGLLRPPGGGR